MGLKNYFNSLHKVFSLSSEEKIELIFSIKSRVFLPGKHIYIACFPKSGSTFLANTLKYLTSFQFKIFVSAFGNNEHDIYEPKLLDAYEYNTVTHQHSKATFHNINLLKKYSVRPIVLVRNIYDCVVSLRDHCLNENKYWPMGYIAPNFNTMTDEEQLNLIIDNFVPWYLHFYLTWRDADKEVKPYWLTYEELNKDRISVLRSICKYYQLNNLYSDLEIENAFQQATGRGGEKSRLNVGKSGRGKEILTKEQIKKVKDIASNYSSDFTLIGLYK